MKRTRKVRAWIAVSEDGNIYLPGGGFDIYEERKHIKDLGYTDSEIIQATITYTLPQRRKGKR